MTLFEAQTDADMLVEAASMLREYLREPDLKAAQGRAGIIRIYAEGIVQFLTEQEVRR